MHHHERLTRESTRLTLLSAFLSLAAVAAPPPLDVAAEYGPQVATDIEALKGFKAQGDVSGAGRCMKTYMQAVSAEKKQQPATAAQFKTCAHTCADLPVATVEGARAIAARYAALCAEKAPPALAPREKEAAAAPAPAPEATPEQKADCEKYYTQDVEVVQKGGFKVAPKKDQYLALCLKLPAALVKCQTADLKYQTAHFAECDKLLGDNLKAVMPLRKLLMAN